MLLVILTIVCFAAAQGRLLPTPRIVGGATTTIQEHPHQISIERHEQHVCGGSIVTHRHILTAAHCIYGNFTAPLVIRAGSTYRGRGQKFIATQLRTHPNYDRYTLLWDVGVAVVKPSIPIGATSKPINLIRENALLSPGEILTVTGWGLNSYNYTTKPPLEALQAVRVPLFPKRQCNEIYSGRLTNEMLCAGGNYTGFFTADSGGPLITSRGELVGIVSFIKLGNPTGLYPGVYTNVASTAIRKFINANLAF